MRAIPFAIAAIVFVSSAGCASIPDLPSDRELPVREILEHSACELRDAFRSLNEPPYSRFKADEWLISVTLLPQVDSQVTAGAGVTLKSTSAAVSPLKNVITWVLGAAPGVQLDTKTQRTSGVTYTIKSKELIKRNDLICNKDTETYHSLTRHLGVGEWLLRTVSAMDGTSMAEVDKPSLNSTITIKFSGNGSYTFAFPKGSDLANFGGNYSVDEKLQISMAQITPPKKFDVVTLPSGGKFGPSRIAIVRGQAESIAVQDAKSRLDFLQLEQAIRGLQFPQQ